MGSGDKRVDKACKAARKIKKAKRVGSYAWHVTSNKKKYRVQTDAWILKNGDVDYTFATCDCGGAYEERTTICPHVLRVLIEISEATNDVA